MGLIRSNIAPDAVLEGEVRGRRLPVSVAGLPFVPPRQKR
jgi:glycine cleavage system aminomethyltransferase T